MKVLYKQQKLIYHYFETYSNFPIYVLYDLASP